MKVKAFDVFGISAILIVLGLLIAIIVIGVRTKKFGGSDGCLSCQQQNVENPNCDSSWKKWFGFCVETGECGSNDTPYQVPLSQDCQDCINENSNTQNNPKAFCTNAVNRCPMPC